MGGKYLWFHPGRLIITSRLYTYKQPTSADIVCKFDHSVHIKCIKDGNLLDRLYIVHDCFELL